MHDDCAGHFFTLAACNSGPDNPCGMAKRLREEVAGMIDKGRTDRQIFEQLLKAYGAKLLCPHMLP
jgi:cytochrome c-type biogenesis protein CcmH/NrfF